MKYYWKVDVGSPYYSIASLLDPSKHISYLKTDLKWDDYYINSAKNKLRALFESYLAEEESVRNIPLQRAPPEDSKKKTINLKSSQVKSAVKRSYDDTKDELDRYFELTVFSVKGVADDDFDPLDFWRDAGQMFPALRRLARDIFCIQASSAPSERVLSGGKDVITDKRASLKSESINALVCVKERMKFKKRRLKRLQEFQKKSTRYLTM